LKVGELVKLAKWCKNGPVLMQVTGIGFQHVSAIFLGGPRLGSIAEVSKGNLFTLDDYDEAMRKHYEHR
jgi:hypothetical protein